MTTAVIDVAEIRSRFPVFSQRLSRDQPVTYLDSAASAQKPQSVIDHERQVMETHYANAYRGVYRFGAMIDEELEASRATIQKLLHAQSPNEIIFTAGATAALNMVAFGWGRRHIHAGDEIVVNLMEHHANLVHWQQLAAEKGAVLRYLPLTEDGQLDLGELNNVVTEKTKVLAVTGMSNTLGTINPIAELARAVHAVGGIIVVDAAQSAPHVPIHVVDDEVDFLAFSGHKIYGPTGVGVLYGRAEHLADMDPLLYGGHMIDQVSEQTFSLAAAPAKFEAGTLPIVQAISLKTAIELVFEIGFEALRSHEEQLTREAYERLNQIPGMMIYGPAPELRGGILSFTLAGAHPEDLAHLLDRHGVFVRHGHHCTMPLHTALNVPATVRASFGVYNTTADIDRLIEAIGLARQKLRLT